MPDPGPQILKTRDDPEFISFTRVDPVEEEARPFSLSDGQSCSWVKSTETFGVDQLRSRIEPWLTALVQSEHLSLLVGSGVTHATHGLATGEALPGMNAMTFNTLHDTVVAEADRAAKAAGRTTWNFEDQVRAANELLRGLEILGVQKDADASANQRAAELRGDLTAAIDSFALSILEGERRLVEASSVRRDRAFEYLVSFLMSFASRSGTRGRLHLFTTNYDRYLEAGADVAGLRLIDRFVGTLAPVFRASRLDIDLHYNPPGIRGEPRYLEGVARFTKLHGSVDWVDSGGSILRMGLPFGATDVKPYLAAPGLYDATPMSLMVYPNAAKDRETAAYPYVELFRDFAAATCRPNSTVVCYGYGFGDEHINRVLEDMLTIPSTHLVIISRDDPLGRILQTYERLGRHAQITLLVGDHLGDLQVLVDHYLPKPAIDRTTVRMADLLKARWAAGQQATGHEEMLSGSAGDLDS